MRAALQAPLSLRPLVRVTRWQALATAAIAGLAWLWAGGHAALSAALGLLPLAWAAGEPGTVVSTRSDAAGGGGVVAAAGLFGGFFAAGFFGGFFGGFFAAGFWAAGVCFPV